MTESQELYTTFLGALNESASINTFKDLFNVVQKSRDQFKPNSSSLNSGSIAKRAAGLILTFPVLVSTAIKIDNAILISKAIERKCVSLLQILFSAVNLADYSDTSNLYDYLSKFHTNLDSRDVPTLSLDDFIGAMASGMREGAISFDLEPQQVSAIMEELRHINMEAKTAINEGSLEDYNMRKDAWGKMQIQHTIYEGAGEDRMAQYHNQRMAASKAQEDYWKYKKAEEAKDRQMQRAARGREAYEKDLQAQIAAGNAARKDYERSIQDQIAAGNAARREYEKDLQLRRTHNYGGSDSAKDFFKDQLLSGDIKKANELQPTNMAVSFKVITGDNVNTLTGIVGVKAKIYPVESTEILNRIADKYQDSNWLFRFIRASTGELSFWKDIIFSLDKIKKSAVNVAKGSPNAKLFQLLERRAARNNAKFFKSNDANPITTLVISQDEVEYLKKYKGVNLNNPGTVNTIFNGYNLMGLVITNDAADYADFLFDDGSGNFARLSYKALERENKDDSDYKKIVNLLHQGGRI